MISTRVSKTHTIRKTFPAGMEPIDSSDIDAARRVSERERVNQSKPKRMHVPKCERLTALENRSRREWSRWESSDIDEARRVSERERANQSKPKRMHVPKCERLTALENRSRRESNPHLTRTRSAIGFPS